MVARETPKTTKTSGVVEVVVDPVVVAASTEAAAGSTVVAVATTIRETMVAATILGTLPSPTREGVKIYRGMKGMKVVVKFVKS